LMNHSQCARCGEPLTEEFQAAIAAGVDAITKACNVSMNLKPVCDACDAMLVVGTSGVVWPAAELPIGVVTAAIGAPFFLFVLRRSRGHI